MGLAGQQEYLARRQIICDTLYPLFAIRICLLPELTLAHCVEMGD